MQWDLITNIILITSILSIATFGLVGLCQLIQRKSIKKVDPELLWVPLPLLLMTIVYFFFDKVLILNTRPDGSGEPSFPSTHVMVVTTVFLIIMLILPHYIKNKTLRIVLDIVMLTMIALVSAGRILANKHWPVDVVGGVTFAMIFTEIYYIVYKEQRKKNAKRIHKNHQG